MLMFESGTKMLPNLPVNNVLFQSVGIVALVPDNWSDWWQPRHYVISRLQRYFRVVWINPAHHWRDLSARWREGTPSIRESAGLTIYTPETWLPRFNRPTWLQDAMLKKRLGRVRQYLSIRGCQHIILYLWRPEFAPAVTTAKWDLTCYHIDDEYSFSPLDLPTAERESQLIRAVDQVFIHSPALLEKKGSINPNTMFVPNGVDYDAYATPLPEPADLRDIPRPRIGYTGIIKQQLDWPLLLNLARRHLEWSFVFVGPQRCSDIHFSDMARLANVRFLGGKPVEHLASYPQHFDACIMPYRMDGYTKYIYPLKLHEYLASGRPTVGSRIWSLEQFADIIALAGTADEWSNTIAAILRGNSNTPSRSARQATAKMHDWNFIVNGVARRMMERLGVDTSQIDVRYTPSR